MIEPFGHLFVMIRNVFMTSPSIKENFDVQCLLLFIWLMLSKAKKICRVERLAFQTDFLFDFVLGSLNFIAQFCL